MRVPTETDQAVRRGAFSCTQRFATCAAGLAIALASWPAPLRAEVQISVYGGANENFSSRASVDKSPVSDSRTLDWDGNSFQMPPYWGARGTYWLNPGSSWGIALDYTHAKAYAKLNFATDPTYSRLEFTDGLNLLTLNLLYRFDPLWGNTLIPYVGVGAGLSIPHVEVGLKAFPGQQTFEYQFTGAAAQVLAGVEYRLGPSWSLFAEARLSYAQIDADLAGGGSLETDIWSPHLAVGLTYRFGAY
jgi:lipid A oxidase